MTTKDKSADLAEVRREYLRAGLERDDLLDHPIDQFQEWLQQAISLDLIDPTAMSVATVSADGQPSQRTVLLKQVDRKGFVFFTNLESRKAKEIEANPKVSLLFAWLPLERQVKVCGTARKIPIAEALKYFLTRPWESQLAAWASPQSQSLSSRQVLEQQFALMKQKFSQGKVPLPSFWGGYLVVPHEIEFWQGRANRLHDRFCYRLKEEKAWLVERLAP